MKDAILENFIRQIILEIKPSDLISSTSSDIQNRSSKRSARLVRVDRANSVWSFQVAGSSDKSYIVRIKVPKLSGSSAKDQDVQVTCNCPFFKWQGPEHWASVENYLYQKPAGSASEPTTRDPEGVKRICKHVVSALKNFEGYVL